MAKKTRIVSVEQEGADGIFVAFSDGTSAGYVIEELLALRPLRERLSVKPEPAKKRS
jgi:hypothetical protein